MKLSTIKLSLLVNNSGQIKWLPANPRTINDEKYSLLLKSITEDPEMLELRELIVIPHNDKFIVIAWNMRIRCMRELKYKEAPCKVLDIDTRVEKLQAITIKDNVSFGEHDYSALANEWDTGLLVDWWVGLPDFVEEEETEEKPETEIKLTVTFTWVKEKNVLKEELLDRGFSIK